MTGPVDAHEPNYAIPIAAKDNVLSGKPGIPRRSTPALRHPSRTLGFGVFTRPVADGVKDDVGEFSVVGGGCADSGVGHPK